MFEISDGHWMLDKDKNPIQVDWRTSAEFCANFENRIVKKTRLTPEVEVSTVFLTIDHQFGEGPPLLFETMIFGGPQDHWTDRYSTWNEAVSGHRHAVQIAIDANAETVK